MRKSHRRLTVRSETLRHLTGTQLGRVRGGTEDLELAGADAVEGAAAYGIRSYNVQCVETQPKTTPILDAFTRALTLKCP